MNINFKWLSLIVGILSILVGVYLFISPLASLASLSFIFAILLFISGVSEVVLYFTQRGRATGFLLLNGIVSIILAIAILSSSMLEMASLIPYLFAIWVLFAGFTRLFLSFSLRKVDSAAGNYFLLLGILGIITGLVLAAHPLFTGLMVAYIIGFGFIYQGILALVLFFNLRKL